MLAQQDGAAVPEHGEVAELVPGVGLGDRQAPCRQVLAREQGRSGLRRDLYAQGVKANVLFLDAKPAREKPWTERLWIYDFRTNMHFTLKTRSLKRSDLDEFVSCYYPENRHERTPTWSESSPEGRWRPFNYDEIARRDKLNLDIFWIRDKSLEDAESRPEPDVLAKEIAADLQVEMEQFASIAAELQEPPA